MCDSIRNENQSMIFSAPRFWAGLALAPPLEARPQAALLKQTPAASGLCGARSVARSIAAQYRRCTSSSHSTSSLADEQSIQSPPRVTRSASCSARSASAAAAARAITSALVWTRASASAASAASAAACSWHTPPARLCAAAAGLAGENDGKPKGYRLGWGKTQRKCRPM